MDTLNADDRPQHEENMRVRLDEWHQEPPQTMDDMIKFYDNWADTYEKETTSSNYMAPRQLAEYFHKHASLLGLSKDCEILDVAAGTGWAGQELQKLGYTNVDGVEPCEKMFQQAREKQVYRKYINTAAGDTPMPIQDASYDAAVIAGSLPHIKAAGLMDMIRVIKPDGLFVCAGKVNYVDRNAPWMMPTLHQLLAKGIVKKLEIDIPPDYYYMNFSALVLVYQKL